MTFPIDLIIDCDPGIDDALALWLAAAHPDRIHLRAVTTVSGNRPVEITCDNAIRLLDAAGLGGVPVYRGAPQPLDGLSARTNLVHGADGLGGVALPLLRPPQAEPAWKYLLHVIEHQPLHTLTLAAIGPLTNLALAEQHRPGVLRRLKQIVVMGGAVACAGNVTPHAEFNFFADPDAAQVVLQAGTPQLVLFGLDVTSQIVMNPEWLGSIAQLPGRCATASHEMLRAYSSVDPLLHDACPIAWLLDPHLFEGDHLRLEVDTLPGEMAGHVKRLQQGIAGGGSGSALVQLSARAGEVLARVRDALQLLP